MTNIYVLTFLREKDRKPEYFTTLAAILEKYENSILHASESTMRRTKFDEEPFDN